MKGPSRICLFMVGVLLLAACGAPAATSTPVPTTAPTTVPAQALPTDTPQQVVATNTPATSGSSGVTISIWSRGAAPDLINAMVKEWNSTHDVQIEHTIVTSDFATKFATAMSSGQAPDMVSLDVALAPTFAAGGQLTDITDMAQSLPFLKQLSPSHIRMATYEGKVYGLPFLAEGSVLVYNKGLFKQAGLDPEKAPTNWDEIYNDAKAIRALGNDIYGYYFSGACGGCNIFTFTPLIWASGGDILNEDGSQATLTDPAVKSALLFYQKMWQDGLMPQGAKVDTGTDFLGAFLTGKIGMVGSGAFAISTLKQDHPDIDFGVTYLPGETGGKSSFAGGDEIAIPAGSKHVKEAFEFMQWMLSDQVQIEFYAKTSQIPVRTDLADNKYFAADPRLTLDTNAMAIGRTPYTVHFNELIADANGPWLGLLQQAIFEGDVDGAISNAQAQFTTIISGN